MSENDLEKKIKNIIESNYKSKKIAQIIDKGIWYKHTFKIVFEDNSYVFLKLKLEDGSDIQMEKNVADLLNQNKICQPKISYIDESKEKIPYEYGIYEDVSGTALSYLLISRNKAILKEVYRSIGEYFRKYAEITNDFAGVWDTTPDKSKYPIHPINAMYMLEIESGSAKNLFEKHLITEDEYNKIKLI